MHKQVLMFLVKCGILPQEPGYWDCCRNFINQYVNPSNIFCSNTLRSKQTAEMIYPDKPVCTENQLDDFDCSKAGPKKFWEMSREEFDEKVHIDESKISNVTEEMDNFCNMIFLYN